MPTPTEILTDETLGSHAPSSIQEAREMFNQQIKNIFTKKIESPISQESRMALEQVWREVESFILQAPWNY